MAGLAAVWSVIVRSSSTVGSLQPEPQDHGALSAVTRMRVPLAQPGPYQPAGHRCQMRPVTASVTVVPLAVTVKELDGYGEGHAEDAKEASGEVAFGVTVVVGEEVVTGADAADVEKVVKDSMRPHSCRSLLRSAAWPCVAHAVVSNMPSALVPVTPNTFVLFTR